MDKRFYSKLIFKEYLTDNIMRIGFEAPDEFTFKAGQFFNILFDPSDVNYNRSYSILNPPSKAGIIESCIKLIEKGYGSDRLRSMKEGDMMMLEAPHGVFVIDEKTANNDHVFICTGTGVTPFYSILLEHLHRKPDKRFTLIYGAATLKELVFNETFSDLERKHDNFEYIPTLTRQSDGSWKGRTGRVQAHLPSSIEGKTFYICGLKDMIKDVMDALLDRNVDMENIHIERYT
jgi:ferredoxin-NADP reductase